MAALSFEVPASCAHLGPGFGVLGVAVDLALRIEVEETRTGGHAVIREGDMSHLPDDPRHDPILRAMTAAKERFGIKTPENLRIVAHNEIPAFCGLGTKSAAFAGGLGIALRYANKAPAADALLDLLVEIGGTPAHGGAALYGGLVAVCPVQSPQEPLRHLVLRYSIAKDWHFVIARPDCHVGAADAVRHLPASVPHGVIKRTTGRLLGLLHALSVGDEELLRSCMVDEVHVPYRRRLVAGVDQALRAVADEAGAATISGAGPSLVAIARTQANADRAAAAMQSAFDGAQMNVEILRLQGRHHGAVPEDLAG